MSTVHPYHAMYLIYTLSYYKKILFNKLKYKDEETVQTVATL